jgi:hypothetical protein
LNLGTAAVLVVQTYRLAQNKLPGKRNLQLD